VEPDSLQVCAGSEITLIGFNFAPELNSNEVSFLAGVNRVPGIAIDVQFDPTATAQGLGSRLRVIVPGGVSTGNVELRVNGISAGAVGYEACPQIMAFTLGRNETQTFLTFQQILGFVENASFVNLYGINFNDLEEVIFEDAQGTTAAILPNTIERGTIGAGPGQVPTGYTRIGFELHDPINNNVQLNFPSPTRNNMKVRVRSPAGLSNTIELPVFVVNPGDAPPPLLGAVVNSVKVPTGVATGPIRLHYTMYDQAVTAGYRMEVSWSADGGQTFSAATLSSTDPLSDGGAGILPGTLAFRTGRGLFPAGGAFRTFTWDAPNDQAFKQLNERVTDGIAAPRAWTIQFRVRPVLDTPAAGRPTSLPPEPNQFFVTPSFIYYSLADRPGQPVEPKSGEVAEEFLTTRNEDTKQTTADWGPQDNEDALSVLEVPAVASQFGDGSHVLVLSRTPVEDREPDVVDEYYEFNTTNMTLTRKQITSDSGTPCNLADDVVSPGPEGLLDIDFVNPGKDFDEFHLGKLVLDDDVKVFARGDNPMILRISGDDGTPPSPDKPVFICGPSSTFDLNGCPGADVTKDTPPAIAPLGGAGGPGAGAGGDGATMTLGTTGPVGGAVTGLIPAQQGGFGGGGGGETTGAWDEAVATGSKFPGAPGGGGGLRLPGGAGDGGRPQPIIFRSPRGGAAGDSWGDPKQFYPVGGAGGGGGGATVAVTAMGGLASGFTVIPGAPGGGGGGLLFLTVDGAVVLDPTARILASGGNGGNAKAPAPSGAGGGGSGGTIFIKASGPVEAPCSTLEARGGLHGTATGMNAISGSGDGGAGWIRLESAVGGTPTCMALVAQTTLTKDLKQADKKMEVASTAGFPESGILVIEGDEISYGQITQTTFEAISRPAAATHPMGAIVALKGSIAPAQTEVLQGGGVTVSPDAVGAGRGRDGEIQLQYLPVEDPDTGEFPVDPETGEVLTIYLFDTDRGEIRKLDGTLIYKTSLADTDPGLIDASRLVIATNTVLRAFGSRGLRILVTDVAEISGWIDVSGEPGGILRFEDDPAAPRPGLAGRGGAGGGSGGNGGTIEFLNGNSSDKTPANTSPIHGGPGHAPPVPGGIVDETPVPYGTGNPQDDLTGPLEFRRATPGESVRGETCTVCTTTAGGGAGGGSLKVGENGMAFKGFDTMGNPAPNFQIAGVGGSIFGFEDLRFGGGFWLRGGTGGSGGGGSPHVSQDYAQRRIPGSYRFKGLAQYAPGTGGGGGGGAVVISAREIILHATARILARGGGAYQSIDLGGNGGGGAGGTVLVQVRNSLNIQPGAVIDVTGGAGNLPVPVSPGQQIPDYEGNVRPMSFRGDGGNGSPGRVRIEAAAGSLALLSGVNSSVSTGQALLDVAFHQGISRGLRLGLGSGGTALTEAIDLDAPQVEYFEFGQPPGTDSAVLWQGAGESLDQHGGVGLFRQLTVDPRTLIERKYVRFIVPFYSNFPLQRSQTLNRIRLPYRLEGSAP
jgi:hypothetical protein